MCPLAGAFSYLSDIYLFNFKVGLQQRIDLAFQFEGGGGGGSSSRWSAHLFACSLSLV